MRERIYLCKFDKWLSEKVEADSWVSVAFGVVWLLIGYPTMYYLPQIAFYVNGAVIPEKHHYGWTMKWFNFLSLMVLLVVVLKIIRLLQKRKTIGKIDDEFHDGV